MFKIITPYRIFWQFLITSHTRFFFQKRLPFLLKSDFLTLSFLFCVFFAAALGCLSAQSPGFTLRDPLVGVAKDTWLRPDSTFNTKRFYIAAGTGVALYGTASTGLYYVWYSNFDRVGLRSFDDWYEWNQMDKAGHLFTSYMFSRYAFAGLRWSGMKRPAARYTALGVANLLQGTIELMDGHSAGWGFSWSDFGANVAGGLVFTVQDAIWHEQRILLKLSNDLRATPDIPVFNSSGAESNLGYIVEERFGTNFFERYLKDYNAQTIWMSANPRSFFPQSKIPVWLNVAVGYGVENVYGAYANVWQERNQGFRYEPERYRQIFLSPDIYFSRIPTKKRWIRLALGILDFVKVPAPALEFSEGKLKGHWLMW